MLVFIVPLRSARVSSSWPHVCKLLERTLRSICNQTSSEFKVFVVCHEKPEIKFWHPSINYIEVEFEIPSRDFADKERDRARKIWVGLQAMQSLQPNYVMFVDSDDCVSKRLVEFVNHHPSGHGWFISQGYEHPDQSNILYFRRKNFQYKSATSYIFSYVSLRDFIAFDFDKIVTRNFLDHQHSLSIMRSKNYPLDPLPFPGAVYITENGENNIAEKKSLIPSEKMNIKELIYYYGGMIYKPFITQKMTDAIREEFYLYPFKVDHISKCES
jgi:hypothetical protein